MITLRTSATIPLIIDMEMRSPSVYLDHCVIGDFADNPILGGSFRDVLQRKNGTLCLSALHLVESSGLCPGEAYSRIKSFLASFGKGFIILEFDPNIVIAKEKNRRRNDSFPAFDYELIKELVLKWNGLSRLDVGILLNILEQNPSLCEQLRTSHKLYKKRVHEMFRAVRHIYQTDAQAKNNILTRKCLDPVQTSMTEYLYCEIRRMICKEDLTPNDVIDFFHSIVSASFADFVVLDKKWASRIRRVQPPMGSAKVFATTEYDSFVQALAA